ncbi:MAG: hypothetical protein D6B25_11900 [Desulfobulbaceae bacterium]|nr:MAG: hypothetical protein D6B25_11900 [Desulfobulbaceae bacterium]
MKYVLIYISKFDVGNQLCCIRVIGRCFLSFCRFDIFYCFYLPIERTVTGSRDIVICVQSKSGRAEF